MRKNRRTLLLKPQYVPIPLSGFTAFKLLRNTSSWRNIRTTEMEKAGTRCSVCKDRATRLYCHERWRYRDNKRVALLAAFAILCHACHCAIHADWAAGHGMRDVATAQLCRVNGITVDEAADLFKRAWEIQESRREKRWKIKVSKGLLKRYPQLVTLEQTPVRSAVGLW